VNQPIRESNPTQILTTTNGENSTKQNKTLRIQPEKEKKKRKKSGKSE